MNTAKICKTKGKGNVLERERSGSFWRSFCVRVSVFIRPNNGDNNSRRIINQKIYNRKLECTNYMRSRETFSETDQVKPVNKVTTQRIHRPADDIQIEFFLTISPPPLLASKSEIRLNNDDDDGKTSHENSIKMCITSLSLSSSLARSPTPSFLCWIVYGAALCSLSLLTIYCTYVHLLCATVLYFIWCESVQDPSHQLYKMAFVLCSRTYTKAFGRVCVSVSVYKYEWVCVRVGC